MRERERERENVHALITVTFEEIVQVRMQVNKSIKDPMAKRNSSQQQKRPRKIRKHNPLRNTRGSFQIKISLSAYTWVLVRTFTIEAHWLNFQNELGCI